MIQSIAWEVSSVESSEGNREGRWLYYVDKEKIIIGNLISSICRANIKHSHQRKWTHSAWFFHARLIQYSIRHSLIHFHHNSYGKDRGMPPPEQLRFTIANQTHPTSTTYISITITVTFHEPFWWYFWHWHHAVRTQQIHWRRQDFLTDGT